LIVAGAIAVNTAFVATAQADTTTGSIAGQIVDAAGAPAPSVNVFITRDDGSSFAYVNTDSAGHYEATGLKPGKFNLQFTASWGGYRNYDGTVDVVAGGQTMVNYALPPTGALAGRLTRADGSAAAGFEVRSNWNARRSATTDANGNWRLEPVWAVDDNFVYFQSWQEHVVQYAYGKLDGDKADRIAVLPGETAIVNETLLPTGSVRVTATDSVTGAPVSGFFAYIRQIGAREQDGAAVLTGVPIGPHELGISMQGYVDWDVKSVTVVAGQTVDVAVKLVPEARIAATVVDAATGQPIAGVCVAAVSPAHVPAEGCGPVSDENGHVSVDYLTAGQYRLLAVPQEAPGYGAQWVGTNGGTGRQHRATVISVQAGQTATAPVIKMDRAGTITGTVTKADGTRPLRHGVTVGLLPVVHGSGEPAPGSVGIDENDRYTLDFLGPYDWELFFTEVGEAAQWSGGVANPLFATTIRVTVGQTATYNFKFRAAVRVTVAVTGLPPLFNSYYFIAHNAVSGFPVAQAGTGDAGGNQVTLLMVGPEFVRFQVNGRWFGGADFAHARTFWIPVSGSKTITLDY